MCVCVGDRKSGEVPESLGTPFALFPGFCSESLFFFERASSLLAPCPPFTLPAPLRLSCSQHRFLFSHGATICC